MPLVLTSNLLSRIRFCGRQFDPQENKNIQEPFNLRVFAWYLSGLLLQGRYSGHLSANYAHYTVVWRLWWIWCAARPTLALTTWTRVKPPWNLPWECRFAPSVRRRNSLLEVWLCISPNAWQATCPKTLPPHFACWHSWLSRAVLTSHSTQFLLANRQLSLSLRTTWSSVLTCPTGCDLRVRISQSGSLAEFARAYVVCSTCANGPILRLENSRTLHPAVLFTLRTRVYWNCQTAPPCTQAARICFNRAPRRLGRGEVHYRNLALSPLLDLRACLPNGPTRVERGWRKQSAIKQRRNIYNLAKMCGTLCLLCRIPAVFAPPPPPPPPPPPMLDDSSASPSLWPTLLGGGAGEVEFGPKNVCFHVKTKTW